MANSSTLLSVCDQRLTLLSVCDPRWQKAFTNGGFFHSRPRVLRNLLSHRQLRWFHHEGEAKESDEIDGEESKGRTLGDYDRCRC
ncbi:hypothetical protein Bca4012_058551 [Brassica carinata]